ncbi:MAG: lactonase family protein [Deltaproteobacteria bacterium]|nr:lactonase family protein [Deltaproteobacteria bacterium]
MTHSRSSFEHSIVYVGNADSNEIFVLQLEQQTGHLRVIERVPIPDVVQPGISTPMAVSPDRRFLYVGVRGQPQRVASFAITPASGQLTYIASGPLADSMAYLVTDRTGRFLLGASYPGHTLTVNRIDPPGRVHPPHQVLPHYRHAHSILVDAQNRYVLAPTLGSDCVSQLILDVQTGILTPNTPPSLPLPANSTPRHLVFHPDGNLVYVLGERDGAVTALDYDATTGLLRQKQRLSALPPDFQGSPLAADLHITPNGRFLYASERTSSTLTGFSVDPTTGTLATIGSVPTERQPRGFNIDPSGRYVLAVGQLSHALSSYQIDPDTGHLIKLNDYPMGKNPNWVETVEIPSS